MKDDNNKRPPSSMKPLLDLEKFRAQQQQRRGSPVEGTKPSKSASIHHVHPHIPEKQGSRKVPPRMRDVTAELARDYESLELYPTKSAPTVAEIKEQVMKDKELEKLRYFGVPAKMYVAGVDQAASTTLTEDETAQLNRYGSRIILDSEGHVVGLEVREDLLEGEVKKQKTECCRFGVHKFEVSENLRNGKRTRRFFMARVLLIEMLLKLPILAFLFAIDKLENLRSFLYHQLLLQLFMIMIGQATRAASLNYSNIGRFEPCKSTLTFVTVFSQCLMASLWTLYLSQLSNRFNEITLKSDPPSLAAINRIMKPPDPPTVYMTAYMIVLASFMTFVIYILLRCTKRMNELGNSFVVIYFSIGIVVGITSFVLAAYGILEDCRTFDGFEICFGSLFATCWVTWRFYHLQNSDFADWENYLFPTSSFSVCMTKRSRRFTG